MKQVQFKSTLVRDSASFDQRSYKWYPLHLTSNLFKVIPFNCIVHPFCVISAHERVHLGNLIGFL